ncbi:MAG: hypothetical protein KKH83_04545 [Candidatus Margulisbacteria bacterium]|nr:hypothetical protein [Candidatus Margulisiibacteriota bacterium]
MFRKLVIILLGVVCLSLAVRADKLEDAGKNYVLYDTVNSGGMRLEQGDGD